MPTMCARATPRSSTWPLCAMFCPKPCLPTHSACASRPSAGAAVCLHCPEPMGCLPMELIFCWSTSGLGRLRVWTGGKTCPPWRRHRRPCNRAAPGNSPQSQPPCRWLGHLPRPIRPPFFCACLCCCHRPPPGSWRPSFWGWLPHRSICPACCSTWNSRVFCAGWPSRSKTPAAP